MRQTLSPAIFAGVIGALVVLIVLIGYLTIGRSPQHSSISHPVMTNLPHQTFVPRATGP